MTNSIFGLNPVTVSVIRDFIVSIVAILTFFIAWRGLSTWRRQLKGNAEWEASRRLLRATYKVRDAIQWLRFPARFKGEDSFDKSFGEKSADPALQKRWITLSQAFSDFQVEQIEAEVLWGSRVREDFEPLQKLFWRIGSSVGTYLEHAGDRDFIKSEPDLYQKLRRTLVYSGYGDETDPLEKELCSAITMIERLVRPRLGKKRT